MVDPEKIEGKAAIFTEWEDRLTIFDTMILCRFYRDLYQWDQLSQVIRITTGRELDATAMRRIAAGVTDAARRFNIREGLKPADDRLPDRLHREALPETGKIITAEQMGVLLREYYRARGWDKDGVPPQ
jgi:aldehyde:ferredoxin oxidoreductase